ncbi:MAG: hypothetical protein KDD70_04420 [Bdellovibrionales bacterium]|nr:hypothetical protein [Bdellovibrionales bacterium]
MDFSSSLPLVLLLLLALLPPSVLLLLVPGIGVVITMVLCSAEITLPQILLLLLTGALVPFVWVLLGGIYHQLFSFQVDERIFNDLLPVLVLSIFCSELFEVEFLEAFIHLYAAIDFQLVVPLLIHLSSLAVKWVCIFGIGYSMALFLWAVLVRLAHLKEHEGVPLTFRLGVVPVAVLLLACTFEQASELVIVELLTPR